MVLASLAVIEALINPSSMAVKSLNIGQDNFLASLRLCVVRDSSSPDMPQSLVKTLDDLLTDYADVSQAQNSDIITKSVNLLKIMAEFISTEKKKEEEAKLPALVEELK